ncbi:hypothetical protein G6F42_018743 [Rhizopus arrhizus]|nr:hypothetical protein G6F42_018743 [Rhizopus arrhizus]
MPWNPNDQLYIDGSVENDLPMNKLSELFNVNHFIVCQVNPHVIPFLQKANTPSKLRQAANFCMHMAKTEAQHRCTQLTELGILPSFFYKIQSIMSQKYSGDITIVPEVGYSDFLKVLSNPTPEYAMDCVYRGERATWPSKLIRSLMNLDSLIALKTELSVIKNHLQIELSIDQILYRLRLLRLNELPNKKLLIANNNLLTKHYHNRPSLEARSTSQFNVRNTCMSPIDESDEITPRKHTEMIDSITDTLLNIPEAFTVQSSQSTPMIVALSDQIHLVHGTKKPISTTNDTSKKQQEKELRRERHQTKRGLLMTKPE